MDTTDAAMSPFIMGVTNLVTAYLPVKWSRWFPLIPLALGAGYGFLVRAGTTGESAARAGTGAGAIALYSLVRNVFGTKPKDAK